MLDDPFPDRVVLAGVRRQELRYGENPHQMARYSIARTVQRCAANQLQGKELSFNNLNDTDAAFELVAEFQETACAIIKHANPSGVAISGTLLEAYQRPCLVTLRVHLAGLSPSIGPWTQQRRKRLPNCLRRW